MASSFFGIFEVSWLSLLWAGAAFPAGSSLLGCPPPALFLSSSFCSDVRWNLLARGITSCEHLRRIKAVRIAKFLNPLPMRIRAWSKALQLSL